MLSYDYNFYESLRGNIVTVVFKPHIKTKPIRSRLYNIDPISRTILLFTIQTSEKINFKVIMHDSVETLQGKL